MISEKLFDQLIGYLQNLHRSSFTQDNNTPDVNKKVVEIFVDNEGQIHEEIYKTLKNVQSSLL